MNELDSLARNINLAHKAASELAESAIEAAYEAGRLLSEAKSRVNHGQWLPWLKANCPKIAERTASQYMRVSRNWETIKLKSAGYADLTINGALQLVPAHIPPMPARYDGWYDPTADQVWSRTSHIKAFRDAIMLPDIMSRLTTEQIAPLAKAIFDELSTLENLGRDEAFTPAAITSAVKRRYREVFEKTAEQKHLERESAEPQNKLVRELREGEAAMRKATHALSHIDYLKEKHPDLVLSNTGMMAGKFEKARQDMKNALFSPTTAAEKDITPQVRRLTGPEPEPTELTEKEQADLDHALLCWEGMSEKLQNLFLEKISETVEPF